MNEKVCSQRKYKFEYQYPTAMLYPTFRAITAIYDIYIHSLQTFI